MRILICAAALLSLSACSQTKAPERPAVGMANPASVYCVEKGGKLLPQKDAQGNEYSLCQLPDGRTVEEWTLFRADHPR
ncbi:MULTISPECIES: putative hemolysin [Chromobacterium]|uniref:DUF333 domain-containing protein n=1 Tax=Chromobacterium haemolyticum TaxID=394935 RepID=A0A1W0CH78_9NEIS|nr:MULTISPECIES: DUF333 domain-containing protein [Chromobacterium]OQS34150.1 hypothetical protein B0T45_19260 [Chromobacterium haemolyticum]QOZ82669.1 DUF333 domain-containing protein [Chromobacterium sp. Rain0013]WON82732.1 DUF333 domain-containing protein [Chromobacterium haemolyticum]